jgi:multiple sugar transport system permease protein
MTVNNRWLELFNKVCRVLPFNLFVWLVLLLYMLPIVSMLATAMMSTEQLSDKRSPLYPARIVTYSYKGKDYQLYQVPLDGSVKQLALIKPGTKSSQFIDPEHPEAGPILWKGGWKTLTGVYEFHINWQNFTILFNSLPFPAMLRNTLIIILVGEVGVLVSSIICAYGFARFSLPGGNLIFYILIATILIPDKITTLPTYFVYVIFFHWRGTIYPILLPLFFGNAVYIFLLRQNFRSIPIDLEEAAMLDGAGPLRRLFSVILPQSWPVVVTVSLLHFFYMWNETRVASLYLTTTDLTLMPISFAVQTYQSRLPIQNVIQAGTVVILVIPVIILFLAQRLFMQGVIVTGAEK